jgi:restriction system protein
MPVSEFSDRENFHAKRVRSLEIAYEHLMTSGMRIVVVEGPPGSGKTSFARQFADRFAKKFPGGVRLETGNGQPDEILYRARANGAKLLIFDGLDEAWPSRTYGLERVTDAVQGDPALRVLATARPGYRHHFDSFQLPAPTDTDIAELIAAEAGFDGWMPESLVRLADGNVLLASTIGRLAQQHGDFETASRLLRPFEAPGLVNPIGEPLGRRSSQGRAFVQSVQHVDDQLMQLVYRDPELVYQLPSRKFEEISAELFQRLGYDVTLTPASKDGGKDLIVVSRSDLGTMMAFVECKLYARDKPVGVSIVERLHGVVERGRATSGIVLTTSSFTRGARLAADEFRFRLNLKDYADFRVMLDRAMRRKQNP